MQKKLGSRKLVLQMYPYAYAQKWKELYRKDIWTIWNNNMGKMSGIGKGYTQKEAWSNAAEKVTMDESKGEMNTNG